MISIEQWRASVGSFIHRRGKIKNNPVQTNSPFWFFNFVTCLAPDSTYDIKVASTVVFILLIVSGSVEQNPGSAKTIEELERLMESRFLELSNENNKLKREIENLKELRRDVDKDHDHLDQLHHYFDENSTACNDRLKEQERRAESQEIYSRRENILIKGIPEEAHEDVEKKVIEIP